MRLLAGGWARQVTVRELHWHPTTVPAEVDDHYTLVVGIEGNIALTLDALAQRLTPKSGLVAIGQKIRAVLQEEREKGARDALFPVKPQRLVAGIRAALARVDPLQAVVYSAALGSGTGNAVTIAMIY
jgi:thiamine pyrophosphate-dependent acetolactate synthase large subunit-like protein